VQHVVFAVPGNGRLLLAPSLAGASLSSGNRLLDLPQEARVAPRGFVQASAMGIRQDEEVPALTVHRFEQRHQVRRFVEHKAIFHGNAQGKRPEQAAFCRAEERHPANGLGGRLLERVSDDRKIPSELGPCLVIVR
jgi:hypothetical protein